MKLERIIPSCLIRDTRIAISKKKKNSHEISILSLILSLSENDEQG